MLFSRTITNQVNYKFSSKNLSRAFCSSGRKNRLNYKEERQWDISTVELN